MMLMVVLAVEDMAGKRIHFSGFDSDWPGELVYQFCGVEDETAHLNYQHCDARPGASGVYSKMWDPQAAQVGEEGHWDLLRSQVAGEQHACNVAVRFTAPKFAQICYWIKGDYTNC